MTEKKKTAETIIPRKMLPEEPESKAMIGQIIKPGPPSALPLEAIAPKTLPSATLQQFFDGQINLDSELAQRFTNVPVMSTAKFRVLGNRKEHGVATITAQDESSWVVFDVDKVSHVTHIAFTLGGMLSLRFKLEGLNDIDRKRWIALMRRDEGGLAFLWGPQRWEHDYAVCVKRKFFTNIFAFSPGQFEAAIRMTPDVTRQLVNWLEKFWETDAPDINEPPPILTW